MPEPFGMRHVVPLGCHVQVSTQNERFRAGAGNEALHVVVPSTAAIESTFAAAVGDVNTQELKRRNEGGQHALESQSGATSKDENSQEITRP